MSYFIVPDVVLQQMCGKANYRSMQQRYPDEIRRQVRDLKEKTPLGGGASNRNDR